MIGLQGSGGPPSLDSRVAHIASLVRCPVCNGETAAQSQAAPSVQIMNEIRTDLQKGESQNQILSSIVASYGPGILEKPPARGHRPGGVGGARRRRGALAVTASPWLSPYGGGGSVQARPSTRPRPPLRRMRLMPTSLMGGPAQGSPRRGRRRVCDGVSEPA